ncbi:MAG: DUF1467 family protein [Candidatus Puniceispirillales bacterium]|tara:strand:- start:718 stop:954 length:237 start_codon:yes stop_codon:yes gene_type:complete
MGIVSGIVVYVLLWWWVLFMLLPIKASPPENPTTGHATSAPKNPYIFYKFFASTIISGLLWILTYYIITNKLITLNLV